MVLRSSPWESRTSLTNKGHFASRGRGGLAILRRVLALLASQFEPSVRSALFVSARRLTMPLAPTLRESLGDSLGRRLRLSPREGRGLAVGDGLS